MALRIGFSTWEVGDLVLVRKDLSWSMFCRLGWLLRLSLYGAEIFGQLIEAVDSDANTTLVALAHGSEELGWIDAASYPYQLAGRGVSVFVYDKRGTGQCLADLA